MRLRCPALVLRRWPYSESSLTLRLLTPELGTVPVLAKGVHKLKSGALGVLDTWALVDVQLGGSEDRELLDLHKVELLDRMSGLSRDVPRLAAAGVLAEIAELAAPPGQPAPEVFLWLQRNLQELAGDGPPLLRLLMALLEGLDLLGLAPRLRPERGADEGSLWFSPAAGGVLGGDDRPTDQARRISPAARELMRRLQGREEAPQAPCEVVAECLTILGDFLHYHLERPPKAWRALFEPEVAPS